jgi:CoA:oxalate CoA-transferase
MGMLSDYRVIDFTNFVSGPTCTRILADMGAEVIRIERPDKKKGSGPYFGGERTVDLGLMRGKKSVTLNAKDPDEHKILMKLIQSADVIVENFRPGVTKRMGIDYETVKALKPDIIYTSISGFGQTSPYKNRGAFDIIIQAMSGFMSVTGERNGKPVRAGISVADICSGIEAAFGTVCMLLNREKTGKGNHLDLAMLDTLFATCNNPVTQYLCSGKIATRIGNEHPQDVPWGDFPTADGYFILAVGRTNTYRDLCKVLHCEEYITDPRFCNDEVRLIHKQECHEMVASYTKKWKTADLIAALNEAGVPCSTVNTIDEACKDPSLLARDMIVTLTHKTGGPYKAPGSPLKFEHDAPKLTKGSPILGENNREVFASIGMSKEEIDALLKKQQKVRTFYPEFALD